MMKRKAAAVLLALTMVCTSQAMAFAGQPAAMGRSMSRSEIALYQTEDVQPYWNSLISIVTRLDEDPVGYASPFYIVSGDGKAITSIRFQTTLQRYDSGKGWVTIKTWDETKSFGPNSPDAIAYYTEYKVDTSSKHTYRFNYTIEAKNGKTVVDRDSGTSKTREI